MISQIFPVMDKANAPQHFVLMQLIVPGVCSSPVVQQNVGAFDVSVQEVVLVAVVQALHQLPHEAADVLVGELDQAWLQQAHQVVVHVLEHQVKST